MKNFTKYFFAISLFSILSFSTTAQVDYFLKFDGVDGESTDSKHDKWIDVLSWSFGESNSGRKGSDLKSGLGASSIILEIDASTPKLKKGSTFPGGTLKLVNNRKRERLIIKFRDIMISSYQTGGSTADVVPTEQVTFNFEKVKFEYYPEKGKQVVINHEEQYSVILDRF